MAQAATHATMVANLELRSSQYKRETAQVTARNKMLAKEFKSTANQGNIFARSMRGAAQGVTAVDGPLGGVAGRLGAVNSMVTSGSLAWTGFGVAVAGATALIYKSIRAAEEMERQQLKIEALLRATSNASGRTAADLDEQARAVARNTLASVSGIRDAQGVLLTFKSVQTDVFDQAIVLSQDLAAVMGGDAKSAALQLGKALEDPATGLTALKRSGVSFTEAEKEQIKTMQESGRVAEAQRFILAKLAQQVGGAGSGEAGGLAGQVDTLSQNWEEFLEAMGRTEEASKSVGFVADAISWWRTVLMPTEAEKSAEKYFELQDKYRYHQKQLAKAVEEGVTAQIEYQGNLVEKYRSQLQEIKDADLEAAVAQREERRKAAAAAEAVREQAERDRIARELQMTNDAGAAQLIQLDQFLANKRGKLDLEHQQRLQQIEALQLSEQELARRGYESLELLKAEYKARENERYQLELEEQELKAQERENRMLERERDLQEQMTKIQNEQLAKRKKAEEDLAAAKMAISQNLLGIGIAAAKEGSKAQRALLVVQKAIALRQSLMQLQVAIANANSVPWPANIPAIAQASAIGLSAITSLKSVDTNVAGIAHGGLDYVPAESTYLLDKGERVLSPNQNADLTSALKNGGMGSKVTVNIIEDASKAGKVERDRGLTEEDVIRIYVANVQQGGDAANINEVTYNLQRTGR